MNRWILFVCVFSVISVAGCKKDNSGSSTDTELNQVKKDLSETAADTKDYLAQQKNAFIDKTQESYTPLENETQELLTDLKTSGKEKWQALSSKLNDKLTVVQEKFKSLKEASAENIEKSKDAFNAAIDDLKQAYEDAKSQFQQDSG